MECRFFNSDRQSEVRLRGLSFSHRVMDAADELEVVEVEEPCRVVACRHDVMDLEPARACRVLIGASVVVSVSGDCSHLLPLGGAVDAVAW